jgi:hypothetical protein
VSAVAFDLLEYDHQLEAASMLRARAQVLSEGPVVLVREKWQKDGKISAEIPSDPFPCVGAVFSA